MRVIDESKCIGCRSCIEACTFTPHRIVWNPEKNTAAKCDLCLNAPYWGERGGPDGKQACIEVCPAKAINLVKKAPVQAEDAGYDVNLEEVASR